jgi:hypothetical protein
VHQRVDSLVFEAGKFFKKLNENQKGGKKKKKRLKKPLEQQKWEEFFQVVLVEQVLPKLFEKVQLKEQVLQSRLHQRWDSKKWPEKQEME